MMTSTVTIPAAVVADTREPLLCLLNRPGEAVSQTLAMPERELHPERFEDDRRHFGEVCGGLDTTGWDPALPSRKVQVTSEDAPTIREAIEGYLPLVEQWLPETT